MKLGQNVAGKKNKINIKSLNCCPKLFISCSVPAEVGVKDSVQDVRFSATIIIYSALFA